MLTSKLWLQEGMTPLHHLVQHGQGTPVEVAEVLVEAHPGALAQASKVGVNGSDHPGWLAVCA